MTVSSDLEFELDFGLGFELEFELGLELDFELDFELGFELGFELDSELAQRMDGFAEKPRKVCHSLVAASLVPRFAVALPTWEIAELLH